MKNTFFHCFERDSTYHLLYSAITVEIKDLIKEIREENKLNTLLYIIRGNSIFYSRPTGELIEGSFYKEHDNKTLLGSLNLLLPTHADSKYVVLAENLTDSQKNIIIRIVSFASVIVKKHIEGIPEGIVEKLRKQFGADLQAIKKIGQELREVQQASTRTIATLAEKKARQAEVKWEIQSKQENELRTAKECREKARNEYKRDKQRRETLENFVEQYCQLTKEDENILNQLFMQIRNALDDISMPLNDIVDVIDNCVINGFDVNYKCGEDTILTVAFLYELFSTALVDFCLENDFDADNIREALDLLNKQYRDNAEWNDGAEKVDVDEVEKIYDLLTNSLACYKCP